MKKVSIELEKEIIDFYLNHKLSTTQIATKTNLSSTCIYNIIKRNGIILRNISESKKNIKRGSKLQVEKIIQLYSIENKTSTEIAFVLGCSKRSVLNVLTENNVERRKSGWSELYKNPNADLIINLYTLGKSMNDIKKELGISYTLINKILKKENIIRTENKHKGAIGRHMSNEHKEKMSKTKKKRKKEGKYDHIYLKKTGYTYEEFQKKIPEFKKYYQKVKVITESQNLSLLENIEKRGRAGKVGAFHVDHMYSIIEGFRNNIEPEIIGNIFNLEMIPWELNLIKQGKCSITLKKLKMLIEKIK
jgi:predicted DNA-binding protein YlxM (UPF0122 family)